MTLMAEMTCGPPGDYVYLLESFLTLTFDIWLIIVAWDLRCHQVWWLCCCPLATLVHLPDMSPWPWPWPWPLNFYLWYVILRRYIATKFDDSIRSSVMVHYVHGLYETHW